MGPGAGIGCNLDRAVRTGDYVCNLQTICKLPRDAAVVKLILPPFSCLRPVTNSEQGGNKSMATQKFPYC
jgi:hypothetical protein